MTAADVRDALRVRHPALGQMGGRTIPGQWTCLEELYGIDLVAFSSWSNPVNGPGGGARYPRVAYEVKVTRSDMRRELLAPTKRLPGIARCHAFYFAVPRGLLTADELAWAEPVWEPGDFDRAPCPNAAAGRGYRHGACWKGRRELPFVGPLRGSQGYRPDVGVPCDACGGRGYSARSRVEEESPTLWVPRDCGLVEVDGRGCRVAVRAPVRKDAAWPLDDRALAELVRWTSYRPDPRHRR